MWRSLPSALLTDSTSALSGVLLEGGGFAHCSGVHASKKEDQVNQSGGNVTTGQAGASPGNQSVFSRACYDLYIHEHRQPFGQEVEGVVWEISWM